MIKSICALAIVTSLFLSTAFSGESNLDKKLIPYANQLNIYGKYLGFKNGREYNNFVQKFSLSNSNSNDAYLSLNDDPFTGYYLSLIQSPDGLSDIESKEFRSWMDKRKLAYLSSLDLNQKDGLERINKYFFDTLC